MKKKDMMGIEPQLGDIIVFVPPYSRTMTKGKIVKFSTGGLPIPDAPYSMNSIRTPFVIIKDHKSWP